MNFIHALFGGLSNLQATLLALLNSPYAGIALGAVLPYLIAIAQQPRFKTIGRFGTILRVAVTLTACFVASLAETLHQLGTVDAVHLIGTMLQVTISATVLYEHVYRNIGIDGWEKATSAIPGDAVGAAQKGQIMLAALRAAVASGLASGKATLASANVAAAASVATAAPSNTITELPLPQRTGPDLLPPVAQTPSTLPTPSNIVPAPSVLPALTGAAPAPDASADRVVVVAEDAPSAGTVQYGPSPVPGE